MKPHVLVVDDSLTVRMDFRAALNEAGFLVTACESKAAAQRALAGRSFDAVILDVILPDGDGIDLLREIKAAMPGVPVLLLSSEAQVKARIHGLSAGADDYVGKPYDVGYVIRRTRELVSSDDEVQVSAVPNKGRRILVADDSPTYLAALTKSLQQEGHDVICARSGEEALALLQFEQVDAAILDLVMPGIDGLEVARSIKSSPEWQQIPVMLITARDDEALRIESARAGVDEFVRKSPELGLLKVQLRGMLRRSRGPAARPSTGPRAPIRAMASSAPPPPSNKSVPPSSSPDAGDLFSQLVLASGLSRVIGPSTLARACKRGGVDAASMSRGDIRRILTPIRETLRVFLSEEETSQAIERIAALERGDAPDGSRVTGNTGPTR